MTIKQVIVSGKLQAELQSVGGEGTDTVPLSKSWLTKSQSDVGLNP